MTASAADGHRPHPAGASLEPADDGTARVGRLLLWYPRAWRVRYGDEFAELLAAELAEQGPSWRRTWNVAATGLRARLAGAGLAGHPLDPEAAARASLAAAAACAGISIVAGAALWAQLAIDLQWSVPRGHGIAPAMALMSGALAVLAVLALPAAAPVAWAAVAAIARGRGRPLLLPGLLLSAGVAVLVAGSRHFENSWPGTGGHLLAHQGGVPGGVAAFGWAATVWFTSYWVHPAALAAFPAAQIGWMVLCPAAIGCVVAGAAAVQRSLPLSPRAFGYLTRVASVAWAALAAFLAGALCWLVAAGGPGAGALFRAGVIDEAGFTVLADAALGGAAAVRQARVAARTACGA